MTRFGYPDIGGYRVYEPLSEEFDFSTDSGANSTENFVKSDLASDLNARYYFYNTGGTISARWTESVCGVSCTDILLFDPLLKKKLEQNNFTYVAKKVKLSEQYTAQDYLDLKKELWALKKNSYKPRIIFTHGTDYLAYFSSWVKLLAKEIGFYGVVICAQRSHDKPTCELHAILEPAIAVLKSLKKETAVCVTYYDSEKVLLHDPFEIKKTDTYKKQAFWSLNQQYFLRKDNTYVQKNKEKLRIKTKDVFSSYGVEVESFLNTHTVQAPKVVLGSGLGNYRTSKDSTGFYCTKVTTGLLSGTVYKQTDQKINFVEHTIYEILAEKYGFKKKKLEQYSFEALHLFINALNWSEPSVKRFSDQL